METNDCITHLYPKKTETGLKIELKGAGRRLESERKLKYAVIGARNEAIIAACGWYWILRMFTMHKLSHALLDMCVYIPKGAHVTPY